MAPAARALAGAALLLAAGPLGAQSSGAQPAPALAGCDPDGPSPPFLSAANEVYYGCGYLFRSATPQYFSAISRFRSAAEREPNNAATHFLLGTALAGYGQLDSARAVFARAFALDPNVRAALAPRLAERPAVAAVVARVLDGPAPVPPATASTPTTAPPAPGPDAAPPTPASRPDPAFRPGQAVDVRSGGGAWQRGTVVAVEDERGDGSRHLYQVRYEVVVGRPGTATTSRFYPGDVRAATPGTLARPAGPALGGALAYGAYACTHDTWAGAGAARPRVSTPKGAITLRPDGTYRYLDDGGAGRFRYDAATGAVTWLSGPLADQRPERTTFRRNGRTAQVDVTFRDPYAWSCGINLP